MGLDFTKANSLLSKPGLLIIGAGGKEPSANALEAYAKNGGRVLLLGAVANTAGFTLAPKKLGGASASPPWPEAVGLSPSDLRLRSEIEIPLLAPEPNNVAANGLLGRKPVGRGVILAFPLTPDLLPANELGDDPARYYRW